ncbi:MAG: hypothetical protein QXJ68_06885 [Methanocellales archaeon]
MNITTEKVVVKATCKPGRVCCFKPRVKMRDLEVGHLSTLKP